MSKRPIARMRAKIIFYREESGVFANQQAPSANGSPAADQDPFWQLSADRLTSGEVTQLLLLLDELGFADNRRSGQKITTLPMRPEV